MRLFKRISALIVVILIIIFVIILKCRPEREIYTEIRLESIDEMTMFLLANNLDLPESIEYEHFEIIIPETFNGLYKDFADMQESQHLPLRNYRGKSADEYIFSLDNNSFAEIIISDDILIAVSEYDGGSPLNYRPLIN